MPTSTPPGGSHRIRDVHHAQAVLLRKCPAATARGKAHDHVYAAVMQVLRMGMALAAIADDCHSLVGES
jgi:hypothetical protein